MQNGRDVSDKALEFLMARPVKTDKNGAVDTERTGGIREFFSHRSMVVRLVVCAVVWCLMCFLYYGLSIRATMFQGDNNKVNIIKLKKY